METKFKGTISDSKAVIDIAEKQLKGKFITLGFGGNKVGRVIDVKKTSKTTLEIEGILEMSLTPDKLNGLSVGGIEP